MIDFGYCLPIFSGSQDKMARTPMLNSINDLESNVVSSVENLNFNSLWVADHLSMPNSNSILEGWTTISWAAGITKKIKLGNIHFNNLLREPPYTAKIISSLDVLSKGRMNLFFDGGHPGTKNEVTTFGFNFLNDSERIEMLEESICLIKSLWKSPKKNFKGKYYFVDNIFFNPMPYKDRDIPIWIGTLTPSSSTNEWNERISQTVAKFGDWWNLTPIGIESYKIANQEMRNVFKKENRGNLMIFTSEPPFLVFFINIIYLFFKIPYIYLIYDLYPDTIVNLNILNKKNFIVRIWYYLN